jgi:hypothetical protein
MVKEPFFVTRGDIKDVICIKRIGKRIVGCIAKIISRNRSKSDDEDEEEDVEQNSCVVCISLQEVTRVLLHLSCIEERDEGQSDQMK